MNNLILILLEAILCYVSLIILYKKYKTDGIYIYSIIMTMISCLFGLKEIEIMNISIPIGFGTTTSLLLGGNLITQKKGPEGIKNYLIIICITFLITTSIFNISGLTTSSLYNEYANNSYNNIFKYNLRMYISLFLSTTISLFLGSKLFYTLKRIQNQIIISNIFTSVIIEVIDNILFAVVAYITSVDAISLILCIIIRYMIKTLIALFGTIPLYICNKID